MSHSSSTLNAKAIALLKSLGFAAREHYTRYDGATELTDDIFGVRYVSRRIPKSVSYTQTIPVETDTAITVYKNPDDLGIAYLADGGIIDFDISEYSPFQAQNKLASMLAGKKGTAGVQGYRRRDLRQRQYPDRLHERFATTLPQRRTPMTNAWVEYTVTASGSGPVYMFLADEVRA